MNRIPLFTETFFKKNNYFREKLNLRDSDLTRIKEKFLNWQKVCLNFNPDLDKESTDENEFINSIFKEALGYIGKGSNSENFHIFSKYRIDGAGASGGHGYADLALGFFNRKTEQSNIENKAQILIEFKDMNSNNLEQISSRKDRLSPVNQCWNYLSYYNDAKWGIITNFNEIRIYNKKVGKSRYEAFYFIVPDSEKYKIKPLTDESEILKFLSILAVSNLLVDPANGQNVSFAEEILSSQGDAEEKVEKEFYREYKELRSEIFYKLLALNPTYKNDKSKLLELVQKLLDRIIFCWFCEDSRTGLLPTNVLSKEILGNELSSKYYNDNAEDIYSKVKKLFNAIDSGGNFNIKEGYNGELFKENAELNSLKVPNLLFKKVCEIGLKYDFGDENELNVNILGHIFEQSISDLEEMRVEFQEFTQEKEINASLQLPGFEEELEILEHNFQTFDPKKTKRKKEGVFYTPEYITKYIVENTVGAWLKEKWKETEKKHSQLKKNKQYIILREYRDTYLSKIKIIDPACGSGAFLVAAFDYLWNEQNRIYEEIKRIKSKSSELELFDIDSINKTILENNLYGVDLNQESVEISKLSLWLKTASKNKKLNNLQNNIKHGNSLIDDKSIAGDLSFSWKENFNKIFDQGRFDVVIGNPPYVRSRDKLFKNEKEYYFKNYKLFKEKPNLYILFLEKGNDLLAKDGYFGFVTPNSWLGIESAEKLRKHLLEKSSITHIIGLHGESFPGVNVETAILIYKKTTIPRNITEFTTIHAQEINEQKLLKIDQSKWLNNRSHLIDILGTDSENKIVEKVIQNSNLLSDFFDSFVGLQAYETGKGTPPQSPEDVKNHIFDYYSKFDKSTYQYLNGSDLSRYSFNWSGQWLRYGIWLSQPKDFKLFSKPRILIREITSPFPYVFNACYVEEVFLNNKSILNVLSKDPKYSLKFLLTILNSKLISFIHLRRSVKGNRTLFPKVVGGDLSNIPIKATTEKDQIPFIEKAETMLFNSNNFQSLRNKFIKLLQSDLKIEKLTDKLSNWYHLSEKEFLEELKKKKIELSLQQKSEWIDHFNIKKTEIEKVKNKMDQTDKDINFMIYNLYNLNATEIKIIESI
ncbi:Eco57I restriction-modification methylase domain-containing protein [Leptospira sp. 'Mane']|uniref:Eco57I restriction-modification methylase domain-containing protein n=1 Tax=Leptospira sp. 'Mane' TaxID=3387407 RepID=UPI00398AA19E